MTSLRDLPSVDQFLKNPQVSELILTYGRPLTIEAIRFELAEVRQRFAETNTIPETTELLDNLELQLISWTTPTLRPVINATGVILHTNLGRAPLSKSAIEASAVVSAGYSNLEFDLNKGKRGSRLVHAEDLLQHLTGADAAMVVNNNASAVMLALTALARRRAVVIARSQLVEIGGGFRVPDVMKQSGARLVEVGTTNRVHLRDYELALQEKPALFMRAHRSNFQITGFTSEPELAEITNLASTHGIPFVDDLGSGSILDTTRYGLAHEPMVQESLEGGADLVCFSGDKLLGGPQAGIIVGRKDLVNKLKKHPLARAIRADKLCLSALTATLLHYLKGEADQEIPVWRMISTTEDQINQRASAWVNVLGFGKVIEGQSTVGGGSLPGESLPTHLVAIHTQRPSPNRLLALLRAADPPVIARLQDDQLILDPRTVLPEQESSLLSAVKAGIGSSTRLSI
jgi:L-seryl-tRNA(Ser) seleniumtransferase